MQYHAATNSLVLQAADPLAIRELIPASRLLDHPTANVAVKLTLESAKLLRNMGIEAPSPMQVRYVYPGKYTPWDHQRAIAEFQTLHKRCYDLSDPGIGKTNAALWAADYLMKTKVIERALIVAPLQTLETVWSPSIFNILMHRTCSILHGTRERRMQNLQIPADFYILNHDGVKIGELAKALKRRPDINLVVIDEFGEFRNDDNDKYRALTEMLRANQRVWGLTGTPCPNAPTDAFALAKIINPKGLPTPYKGGFRRLTMSQLTQFKWVPKPDGYTHAFNAMQPAIRFKKADCLDLPPVTFQPRQAELTSEQKKAYAEMRLTMKAEAKAHQITAVNAADKISKLRQIALGCVKDPVTGTYQEIPHGPRLKVLMEEIAHSSAKVIVVVPFKGAIRSLAAAVGKHYPTVVLNGDVPVSKRKQVILDFKSGLGKHVMLCHPKVMSHGLNLTEADTLIFFGPIYSNDQYQQVLERFNRAGQVNKMTVVQIAATPLEWQIYRNLEGAQSSQMSMLDLYKLALKTP